MISSCGTEEVAGRDESEKRDESEGRDEVEGRDSSDPKDLKNLNAPPIVFTFLFILFLLVVFLAINNVNIIFRFILLRPNPKIRYANSVLSHQPTMSTFQGALSA